MITIVEPKEHIDKLWGKQRIRDGDTYRIMRYVLRVDHDSKVLLHNVITGQLVVLDQNEARVVTNMPLVYTTVMEQLVADHYLVPEDYDEHQQVVNMRNILRMLSDSQKSEAITRYTILPTTACNARCYYCFEQGVESYTMSEQIANDVVEYISNNCNKKPIHISWFGGEPTVASHRIDQICLGLREKGIQYKSDMTTNGYLFDEDMVNRSVKDWHVTLVMVCVDGTEENYNKTKAYVNATDNPYERVMQNIGMLLGQGVRVNLRMNIDLDNYRDFYELCSEAVHRFHESPLLQVYVHPIVGEHRNRDGAVNHGSEAWFSEKIVELNDAARSLSLYRGDGYLPSLLHGCMASSDSTITINAKGKLVKCPEQFADNQTIGDLLHGITNKQLADSWKEFSDYPRCVGCALFPACARMKNCSAKDRCNYQFEILRQVKSALCVRYDKWKHIVDLDE